MSSTFRETSVNIMHSNILSLYNVPETNLSTASEEPPITAIEGNSNEDKSSLGLEWQDGIARLPGSDLQFRMNENGYVELLDEGTANTPVDLSELDGSGNNELSGKTNVVTEEKMHKVDSELALASCEYEGNIRPKYETAVFHKQGSAFYKDPPFVQGRSNILLTCAFCSKEGSPKKFFGRFCSRVCIAKNATKQRYSRVFPEQKRKRKSNDNSMNDDISSVTETGKLRIKIRLPSSSDTKLKRRMSDKVSAYSPSLSLRQNLPESLVNEPSEASAIFNWNNYLFETQSKGLLPDQYEAITGRAGLPLKKNSFQQDCYLEAVDPMHQSLICLVSIAQVQGYRLRLRFVGFPQCFDFWVNADSPFLFPCGFCKQTGRQLSLPQNHPAINFTLDEYPKNLSASFPSTDLFSETIYENRTKFKVGNKLEAVDKKHFDSVCVATVADVIGDYILIHFDGWENDYDYWASSSSPFIHPVGWCQENGKQIAPPLEHDLTKPFDWSDYMRETKSVAAESSCFVKNERKFQVDMKIEVVDQRNPILIRVATITEVNGLHIKVHFDGWSDDFDDWLDVDNMDIHPINWCSETSHPLQPPVDMTNEFKKSCPVEGCNALGHANTPKTSTYHKRHYSENGCPYSQENFNKRGTYNRFSVQSSFQEDGDQWRGNSSLHFAKRRWGKKRRRISRADFRTLSKRSELSSYSCPKYSKLCSKDDKFRNRSDSLVSSNHLLFSELSSKSLIKSSLIRLLASFSSARLPLSWNENVKQLGGVNEINPSQVCKWSCAEVSEFVSNVTGKREYGDAFAREEVDGEALLLLTQSDISNVLKIKLGPAVKIYNAVLYFKASGDGVQL